MDTRKRTPVSLATILIFVTMLLPPSSFAGMRPDEVERFEEYKVRAEKGDTDGEFFYGNSYFFGFGVEKNKAKAIVWFHKAAGKGHPMAQRALGRCYSKGDGVVKDEIEAYAYFNLAGVTRDEIREYLDILEKTMTREEVAAAQRRTRELQKEIEAKIAAKKAGK